MSSVTETPSSQLTAAQAAHVGRAAVQNAASSRERSTKTVDFLLQAKELRKSYRKGSAEVRVLRGVNFAARAGAFTSIIGQSGSGKSTLLHLLATLDDPDSGEIYFEGNRIDHLPAADRDTLRNQCFGMIFQFYHLLPELTALENVLLPTMISEGPWGYWKKRRAYRDRARNLLEMVGLSHRTRHRPGELSGGEMQRVAIARSIMPRPRVLLADEPTGNLDRRTGEEVLRILRFLNDRENLTIVMVTHDPSVARRSDLVVQLVEGQVQEKQCP